MPVSALLSHHLYIFPLSGQTMDTDGDMLYIIALAASGATCEVILIFS